MEELRRESIEKSQTSRKRVGGARDALAGLAKALLEGVGALKAFRQAAAQFFCPASQFAEAAGETLGARAQFLEPAAEALGFLSEADRAAPQALAAGVELAEAAVEGGGLSPQAGEFFAVGGKDGGEDLSFVGRAGEGRVGGGRAL
jgi:hypothetical protein